MAAALLVAFSCARDERELVRPEPETEFILGEGNVFPGHIRVKLTEEVEDINAFLTQSLPNLEISHIERTFPYSPKFEEKHRRHGLHLWYEIQFDKEVHVTKAAQDFANIAGIEEVEYMKAYQPKQTNEFPFNDPRFTEQWHYYNTGTNAVGAVAGCDINLLPAWEKTTGSRDVVVAILDAGIYYNHQDLADNMWVNEAELNGTPGVDDDGNGYVDDIYGYNFCASSSGSMYGEIQPGDHGTHVAGTVAAVNNNNTGMCGIAGGDGSGNGVRLMSVQMINDYKDGAYVQRAFVYAADMGAIIAQCSWGSESSHLDASTQYGIDYFIEEAGTDGNGNQVGPMKGGIVIVAAGNEERDWAQPAMYERCVAVSALAADYKAAYYTNFGDWVDIAAPGGDAYKNQYVMSTTPYDNYGGMQGTSMACPHVSGVAALVVSYLGGEGFTSENLRDRLLSTARNIDQYNTDAPGYLGVGLVDAAACLDVEGPEPPDRVEDLAVETSSNFATLSWTVPSDDVGKPSGFEIVYGTSNLSDLDTVIQGQLPSGTKVETVLTGSANIGDKMTHTIGGLEFETGYYFRIVAYDNGMRRSKLSDQVEATTGKNTAPVINPVSGTEITLKRFETVTLEFEVSDPDGHKIEASVECQSRAASVALNSDQTLATVTINGLNGEEGTYDAVLTVEDEFGESAEASFKFTIEGNQAPEVGTPDPENGINIREENGAYFSDVCINGTTPGDAVEVDLSKYFVDPDGESLSYVVEVNQQSQVLQTPPELSGDRLTLQGRSHGSASVVVTATDAVGEQLTVTFEVIVRNADSNPSKVDLYPNPVVDILNVRTGTNSTVTGSIEIFNSRGAKVYSNGNAEMSAFAPFQVNMSGMDAGTYSVSVTIDGNTQKNNIVKI